MGKNLEILESLKGSMENMKDVQKSSMAALNSLITPDIEAQMPDDVKEILSKARGSFDLSGKDVHEKQKDLNDLMSNVHNLTKRYASNT